MIINYIGGIFREVTGHRQCAYTKDVLLSNVIHRSKQTHLFSGWNIHSCTSHSPVTVSYGADSSSLYRILAAVLDTVSVAQASPSVARFSELS